MQVQAYVRKRDAIEQEELFLKHPENKKHTKSKWSTMTELHINERLLKHTDRVQKCTRN